MSNTVKLNSGSSILDVPSLLGNNHSNVPQYLAHSEKKDNHGAAQKLTQLLYPDIAAQGHTMQDLDDDKVSLSEFMFAFKQQDPAAYEAFSNFIAKASDIVTQQGAEGIVKKSAISSISGARLATIYVDTNAVDMKTTTRHEKLEDMGAKDKVSLFISGTRSMGDAIKEAGGVEGMKKLMSHIPAEHLDDKDYKSLAKVKEMLPIIAPILPEDITNTIGDAIEIGQYAKALAEASKPGKPTAIVTDTIPQEKVQASNKQLGQGVPSI